MGLTNAYTVAVGRIPDLFARIRDGQAPDQLTQQLLKDWGFSSSNDRAFIPLLKALGLLTPDGKPTPAYHEYRDHSRSRTVMASALREAYSDIFLIKANPTDADKATVRGKFKSYHNVSDHVASLMTNTFYALLKLADLTAKGEKRVEEPERPKEEPKRKERKSEDEAPLRIQPSGLHYNIQIHLPATKDIEVYNAIFKSLKEHLFAE